MMQLTFAANQHAGRFSEEIHETYLACMNSEATDLRRDAKYLNLRLQKVRRRNPEVRMVASEAMRTRGRRKRKGRRHKLPRKR